MSSAEPVQPSSPAPHGEHGPLAPLALGALGIVFGDIGTSPLYALRECFHPQFGVSPTPDNVLGVLSLVLWSLTAVVSVKYLGFIMKADNKGEGGIFALLALIPAHDSGGRVRRFTVLLALFGAALLYGDGVITPAISVLSAVEGLEMAHLPVTPPVVPLTCVILIALFLFQRRGTQGIGKLFGPVMLVWFLAIAVLGLKEIGVQPSVLRAINPLYGLRFFLTHGLHGFVVLGAVVLCITGAEALYADMGHFGRRPIRVSWYALVFPALLLSYFGQGALLLGDPSRAGQPFFSLVPNSLLLPMVVLATLATVIASQALISGAFSLTRQAVQLGYCPRVTIVHTSGTNEGQIYVPEVNSALMVACVALVLAFRESSNLAAAYGIAVTGTMGITSVVYYVVVTRNWGWPRWKAIPLVMLFLVFDLAYFGSNLLKVHEGGWFPLLVGVGVFTLMTTWFSGRKMLADRFARLAMPLELFLDDVKRSPPPRVPGTAVFMTATAAGTPPVLLHHLKHNKMLHEKVVLLSITSADRPTVSPEKRIQVEELGSGFFRVMAQYGFMQTPSVPEIMSTARSTYGLKADSATTSFYLGRETLLASKRHRGMARWRKRLFSFMARNSRAATDYFGIPPGRVVELGMQLDL